MATHCGQCGRKLGWFSKKVPRLIDGQTEILCAQCAAAVPPPQIGDVDDTDTRTVCQLLVFKFHETEGIDLRSDELAMARVIEASRKAVEELQRSSETRVELPFISANAKGPKHLSIEITRDLLAEGRAQLGRGDD